jgi:hypothetical protein
MDIIDNINRLFGDDLNQTLQGRLKVAASCFSMYAFEALRPGTGADRGTGLHLHLSGLCRRGSDGQDPQGTAGIPHSQT